MPNKFINDILKPWDDLNALVARPCLFDLQVSSVSLMAASLAHSIHHSVDRVAALRGLNDVRQLRSKLCQASTEFKVVVDFSDTQKHHVLDKKERMASLSIAAAFEWKQDHGFRFMRNIIEVNHAMTGPRDFLELTLAAIQFLRQEYQYDIPWNGKVRESHGAFSEAASLEYDPQYCAAGARSSGLKIFSKRETGEYEPYSPAVVRFSVTAKA